MHHTTFSLNKETTKGINASKLFVVVFRLFFVQAVLILQNVCGFVWYFPMLKHAHQTPYFERPFTSKKFTIVKRNYGSIQCKELANEVFAVQNTWLLCRKSNSKTCDFRGLLCLVCIKGAIFQHRTCIHNKAVLREEIKKQDQQNEFTTCIRSWFSFSGWSCHN